MTILDTPFPIGDTLNRLIAVNVMGWTWRTFPTPGHYAMMADGAMGSRWFNGDKDTHRDENWRPSTVIADAWMVAEHFIAQRRGPTLYAPYAKTDEGLSSGPGFTCTIPAGSLEGIRDQGWGYGKADTLPLAICYAALSTLKGYS